MILIRLCLCFVWVFHFVWCVLDFPGCIGIIMEFRCHGEFCLPHGNHGKRCMMGRDGAEMMSLTLSW